MNIDRIDIMTQNNAGVRHSETLYEWIAVKPSRRKQYVRVQWKDKSYTSEPLTQYWKDALARYHVKYDWDHVVRLDSKRVRVTLKNGDLIIEPLNSMWRKQLRRQRQRARVRDSTPTRHSSELTHGPTHHKLDLLLQAIHILHGEDDIPAKEATGTLDRPHS